MVAVPLRGGAWREALALLANYFCKTQARSGNGLCFGGDAKGKQGGVSSRPIFVATGSTEKDVQETRDVGA